MCTEIYDFLTESCLFSNDNINNSFSGYTDKELRTELSKYREFVLKTNILEEIRNSKKDILTVFTGEKYTSVDLLKQSALYVDKYIVNDPLFSLTYTSNNYNKTMKKYLGFKDTGIDRRELVKSVKYMKLLTPMVANDFIKFYPVDYSFEPPEQLPIYYPKDHFENLLPKEVMDWFRRSVEVKSMFQSANGWLVKDKLDLSRGIAIQFKEYEEKSGYFYNLFEIEPVSYDENSGEMTIRQFLPDYPPEISQFNAWVYQSINKASKDVFDKVFQQVSMAIKCDASFLAPNKFTFDLLQRELNVEEGNKEYVANLINDLELPFINDVDIETIMKIRNNESDIYSNFRQELESKFIELRNILDYDKLKLQAEYIFDDIRNNQVNKINENMKVVQKRIFADATIFTGGLVCAFQSGMMVTLITLAITAMGGYKTLLEYQEKRTQNPAFFMWKLMK